MTPSWLLDLLAAIMLAIAAVSVTRLATAVAAAGRRWRPGPANADADVAHVLMGIAMAGMFAPGLSTLPNVAWEVVFGLMTAWFAWRALLGARSVHALLTARCTLHLVHSAAMLYMYLALGAPGGGGMGMSGPAMQALRYPTLAGIFVLLLVGYSAWDLDQLSGRRYSLVTASGPAAGGAVSARVPAARAFLLAPGTKVSWEAILSVAMAFMLVTII
jgi:hypothetical protein